MERRASVLVNVIHVRLSVDQNLDYASVPELGGFLDGRVIEGVLNVWIGRRVLVQEQVHHQLEAQLRCDMARRVALRCCMRWCMVVTVGRDP